MEKIKEQGLNKPIFVKGVFILSVIMCIFYFCTLHLKLHVYDYILTGAIFEFISIPMLICLGFVPTAAIFQIIKRRGSFPVLPILSLLFSLAAIALVVNY